MSVLLLLSSGGSVTVTAPMATATGDAFTPTLKVDSISTSPMATATAAAMDPALLVGGGALVSPPIAAATATSFAPSVGTQATIAAPMATATVQGVVPVLKIDWILTSPIATATADALGARFDVTIAAPMAIARAQASPPMGPERAILVAATGTSIPTPARRCGIGDIVHVFTSTDGDSDMVAAVGDWFSEDEDLGGFMAAGGTLPASVVEAHPNIYRYGTTWRSFHVQTRTCVWGGRIKEPRKGQGEYELDGMGWGQVYGDKRIEYLLYQNLGTDGWQAGFSEPWVKFADFGNPDMHWGDPAWETTVQDGEITFKRTAKPNASKANNGNSIAAVFYAPNLPPGESLTRIAFTLNTEGDSQGFSAAGSTNFYGIANRNEVTRTNVQDDQWTHAATSGLTRAMGPIAPHLSISVGYLNEETGQVQNFGEVGHFHTDSRGFDSKWDIGLLDYYPISYGHNNYVTPGSSHGGWAATPGSLVTSALVADPQGGYTSTADGGSYSYAGRIVDGGLNDITSLQARVNIIFIYAGSGHDSIDGSTFVWADDLATGAEIKLRDIRVNALAEGDNMTAGQLVKDIASRTGLPPDYVDGAGWNILPYKIEQGKVAEAWEYASMISNRRARTGDSGCRPTFEFGRYGETQWVVDDDRQELTPIALDRYNRVRVRYELHSATTSVKVHADPDPLPWISEYEPIDLPTPARSSDRAGQFGEDVLEYLVKPRSGGEGRITDVLNEDGARRSAHLVRAGDKLRHSPSRSPRMRVQKVRHTYDDVELTFPDQPIAVERLTARREQRLADGRKWHRN